MMQSLEEVELKFAMGFRPKNYFSKEFTDASSELTEEPNQLASKQVIRCKRNDNKIIFLTMKNGC